MRALLCNNTFLLFVTAAIFAIGVTLSLCSHNFQWLSRFGALIIFLGIVFIARGGIQGEDVPDDAKMGDTGLSIFDPKHYEKVGEPVPEWVWKHRRDRFAVGILGPLVTGLGTILNGFADLLTKVVYNT